MADIVTITPGNYTPGAQSALDAAAALINAAWDQGNNKTAAFESKIDAIADDWLGTQSTPTVSAGSVSVPSVTEPNVDIPASASASDVMSMFDTKYLELVALLADKFTSFRNAYFPDESTAYAGFQTWLTGTMGDPSITPPDNVAALDTALAAFISDPTVSAERVGALNTWLMGYVATPYVGMTNDQAVLNSALSAFIESPSVDNTALSAMSSLLDGYVADPSSPLPGSVIDAIWEDARAKIVKEGQRAGDSVLATFAARRFALPPGAAAAAIVEIQKTTQDKLTEAVRNAAIKAAELSYDKVKFSIDSARQLHTTLATLTEDRLKMAVAQAQTLRQSVFDAIEKRLALCVDSARQLQLTLTQLDSEKLKLAITQAQTLRMGIFEAQERRLAMAVEKLLASRQLAMDSAIKYITALASGPDMASRLVGVGYDAQSKLIGAASQFYNSRTAVAELQAKVGQFNVGTALDAASKNQAAELTLIEDRLKALLTEAQALAQMATALYNNLHTGASLGYSVSVSGNANSNTAA